jgi:hypothetical protein
LQLVGRILAAGIRFHSIFISPGDNSRRN